MRPTVPRLKSPLIPATAIAAAALALLLTLSAIRPAAAQDARPQLQGSITIANPAQAPGAYLGVGDVIWFKIRPSKDLEQISVTPAISDANHFHFLYEIGGSAAKAKLAGIATDSAGQFLLYQHTITAGKYTGADGNLYFYRYPAPAVSAHLQAADGSGQFNFNAPANNSPLAGSARVAAAGPNYFVLGSRPVANPEDIEMVNPPGSGWHRPGDVITMRLVHSSTRLAAIPDPDDKAAQNYLRFVVGPNSDRPNSANQRDAYLTEVGNAGRSGYIEFQYTVQAGDSDPDGIQIHSVGSPANGGHVCPEELGPDCNAISNALRIHGRDPLYVLPSARIAGPELAWSDSAQTEITLAQNVAFPKTGDYNAIGGVTGAVAGYPVIYSAAANLPAGLKLGDHNGRAVIYGTPAATSTGQSVTITAADTTGRQAEIAVTITVNEFVAVSLPANTDGRYNFVSYLQDRNRGGGQLPEATGSAPITYALTQRDGSALPVCIGYNGDASRPGFLVANTDFSPCHQLTSRETVPLRFTATGPDGQTATIDLSFTIDPGAHPTNPGDVRSGSARVIQDMDTNDNGLIEITTPEQLMAIRYDTDGDGRSSNESLVEYYAIPLLAPYGGFHGSPSAATGCPDTGCIGYELANDIDLNQLEAWWKYADSFQILTNVQIDGTQTTQPWNAIFDGNGHTITGVNFQQPGENAIGLFGVIGPNGVVRNLGLVNPNNRGDQSVGAIAGINRGAIENVYVLNGTVAADSSTAGLIAGENYGRIRNFWATGSVNTALGAGAAVGGNYGAGAVSHGWTDGFTEQNAPLGGSQGFTYLTGYSMSGATLTAAREIDSRAATAGDDVRAYLTTDAGLQAATAAAGFTTVWDAAIWDFGDNCQRPTLKSAGHTTAKQSDARQSTCAAE